MYEVLSYTQKKTDKFTANYIGSPTFLHQIFSYLIHNSPNLIFNITEH